jgi:competence protein ComEC
MRVDPILLAAGVAVAAGACVAQPVPAGICVACALALFASELTRRSLALIVLVFFATWARGAFQIRSFERVRISVRDAIGAPSRCDVNAVVQSSPTWAGDALTFVAQVTRADCSGHGLPVPFLARLHGGPDLLARDDSLHLIADLAPVQLFRNLDTADPTPAAARQGVVASGGVLTLELLTKSRGLCALIDRARAHARVRIVSTFAPSAAAMARALVLGENDLTPDDTRAFQKSGLSHMLAVSGTHLVFAVVALVHALTFCLVRIERLSARWVVLRAAQLLGVGLALVYADFAGGGGSAFRAAFMLSVAFLARALGRQPDTLRSFGLSTLIFALRDPLCAFDLSFMLSVAATAGLIWLGRPWSDSCERITWRPLRFVLKSFATTLSATLPCAPLLALLASGVSAAGLLANILAAPLGESVALPLCLGHLLLAPIPPLERGVALVASGALLIVKRIALASADASRWGVTLPEPGGFQLALGALFVLGMAALRGARGACSRLAQTRPVGVIWCVFCGFCWCGLELAARRAGRPVGLLRASALDVGQGDSNLVDMPDGRLLLIDGGGFVGSPVDPGKAVLLPVLRARRRRYIDVVILTHPHPDHFLGLASALEELDVGEFWDTGQGEAEGAGPVYAQLLRALRRRGVVIRRPAELCGHVQNFAGAKLRVLAPCPAFTPGRGANDNSLVISIAYGSRRFLFTGDAEAAEESELLTRAGHELRADYLKVGHHGSRTSTSDAFLSRVTPSLATLSCGVRNRFGHPHAPTVERLAAHGVTGLRLDRSGSVIVTTDGQTFSARSACVPL